MSKVNSKVFVGRESQQYIEAAAGVFLEIWQKSQENSCARASFLVKL